jgi:hypothetical protein
MTTFWLICCALLLLHNLRLCQVNARLRRESPWDRAWEQFSRRQGVK